MLKDKSVIIIVILLISGCNGISDTKTVRSQSTDDSFSKEIPDSVLISPIYPDTIYFVVDAELSSETKVEGNVEGFDDRSVNTHEIYFQRFVEKQGTFRVIHAVGSSIETVIEDGRQKSNFHRFSDTIRFDELGFFAGEPGDPVDLIPLYPGHRVKEGELWTPNAPVKIAMGSGIAQYKFVIDSLYYDIHGSLLALVKIEVTADLKPTPLFANGSVGVSGNGWIIWDCTVNQRRETHLQAVYYGRNNEIEVKQIIKVNDKLKAYPGKSYF